MKKYSQTLIGWAIGMPLASAGGLSLLLLYLSITPPAGAEESLPNLQQKIVTPVPFDEKADLIKKEAERLIEDMKKNPNAYSGPGPEPLPQAILDAYNENLMRDIRSVNIEPILKPASEPPKKKRSAKKPWFWPPKLGFQHYTEPEKISEGDALYRVAVSDHRLTLDECVEIGLGNNLQLAAAKKVVEVAEAKLTEAKRSLFPTVQATWDVNGGHVPSGDTQRFYKGESQKINVSQPLYYGGELTNTVKQAEENVKISKAEYEKTRNDFIHQVRAAYYGVVKAEYNSQYQSEVYEKVGKVYDHVKSERSAKLITEVDYLNVESLYYQTLFQIESSKNDVLSANVVLRQTLDLQDEDPLPVDLKLDFVKINPDFKELLESALTHSADIKVKAYSVEAAKYGMEVYKARRKPHFDLRGSYGMLGEAFHDEEAFLEGKADNDLEKEWYLGVHGSMPLGVNSVEYDQVKHVYGPTVLALTGSDDWRHHMTFNLLDKFSLVTDEKSAENSLLQAESEYSRAKSEVTLKLRDDYYTLQKSLIQVDSTIAKIKYQEKQGAILEYLLSIQETTAANFVETLIANAQDRYAFIQAVTDYNIARSSLSVSIGDPYYFEK